MKFQPLAFEQSLPALIKKHGLRGFLVFGPDEGRVTALVSLIARTLKAQVTHTDAAEVAGGAFLLADALNSASLLGDVQLVHIRQAGDRLTKALQNMDFASATNFFLAEGGQLTGKSSLKVFFETHPNLASVACYLEDANQRRATLRSLLQARKLAVQEDALTYLAESIGGDTMLMMQELEKLALYQGDSASPVSLDDVRAATSGYDAADTEPLLDALLARDTKSLNHHCKQLMLENVAPVQISRSISYMLLRLLRLRELLDESVPLERAMTQCRPPFFFKQQPMIRRTIGAWSAPQLKEALSLLMAAEKETKLNSAQPYGLLERALLAILARGQGSGIRSQKKRA